MIFEIGQFVKYRNEKDLFIICEKLYGYIDYEEYKIKRVRDISKIKYSVYSSDLRKVNIEDLLKNQVIMKNIKTLLKGSINGNNS